jgi:hypothetical protein
MEVSLYPAFLFLCKDLTGAENIARNILIGESFSYVGKRKALPDRSFTLLYKGKYQLYPSIWLDDAPTKVYTTSIKS